MKKIAFSFIVACALLRTEVGLAQIKSGTNSKTPTYNISVDARLLSQSIDRGLAISDRNPAMNAAFLFNLGSQFKLGFWGSNISNLSSLEDNFWFKVLAEVNVEISKDNVFKIYISDDHYYKSSLRNGQTVGLHAQYKSYLGQFEYMNNYEGSKTDAMYLNGGKLFDFKQMFRYGGLVGYTVQHAPGYKNYFDGKLLGIYKINPHAFLELGGTFVIDGSHFSRRADPSIYLAVDLAY